MNRATSTTSADELAAMIPEDDTAFEARGGLDYVDALAIGLYEKVARSNGTTNGVMVSKIDLLRLLEGYARLRSRP